MQNSTQARMKFYGFKQGFSIQNLKLLEPKKAGKNKI